MTNMHECRAQERKMWGMFTLQERRLWQVHLPDSDGARLGVGKQEPYSSSSSCVVSISAFWSLSLSDRLKVQL